MSAPGVAVVAVAASISPRQARKADQVVIPQGLVELAVRAKLDAGSCVCLLLMDYGGPAVIAVGRQVEYERRSAGHDHRKLPTTKAIAASFICQVHLFNADAVAKLIAKSVGPTSTVEMLQRMLVDLEESWGESFVISREGMSVFSSYVFFLSRILAPSIVANGASVLFRQLVPHLMRDLLINHDWHIVQGNRRLNGVGTETRARGLDNLIPFVAIMNYTLLHYCGTHTECGLTRTPSGMCQEAINIANAPEVMDAVLAAVGKVTSFIALHAVINIHEVFANQAVLAAHFGAL